jgi:hypothetical protein
MTLATMFADSPAMTVLPPAPEPSSADEINHRIANSLQLLSAMVSVEASGIADPAARAALDTTRRRIGAIASVHRQLYRVHGSEMVDLRAYLDELGEELERGCADADSGRRVIVRAAPLEVPPEEATSIGILVSELVANTCKYAYAPGAPGDVVVRAYRDAVRRLPARCRGSRARHGGRRPGRRQRSRQPADRDDGGAAWRAAWLAGYRARHALRRSASGTVEGAIHGKLLRSSRRDTSSAANAADPAGMATALAGGDDARRCGGKAAKGPAAHRRRRWRWRLPSSRSTY